MATEAEFLAAVKAAQTAAASGATTYTITITDNFALADSQGDNWKDYGNSFGLIIPENLTLQINGGSKTITGVSAGAWAAFIVTGGTLRVQDLTLDEWGDKVAATGTQTAYGVFNTTTADGGTIETENVNITTGLWRAGYIVPNGTLIVNGGHIVCGNSSSAEKKLTKGIQVGANAVQSTATASINMVLIENNANGYSTDGWEAAGIEVIRGAQVSVTNSKINNCTTGILVEGALSTEAEATRLNIGEDSSDQTIIDAASGGKAILVNNWRTHPTGGDDHSSAEDADVRGSIAVVIKGGTYEDAIEFADPATILAEKEVISFQGGKIKGTTVQGQIQTPAGKVLRPGSGDDSSYLVLTDAHNVTITDANGAVKASSLTVGTGDDADAYGTFANATSVKAAKGDKVKYSIDNSSGLNAGFDWATSPTDHITATGVTATPNNSDGSSSTLAFTMDEADVAVTVNTKTLDAATAPTDVTLTYTINDTTKA